MIVVGGGIAGCTVALALRRHGCPVTLIQAPDPTGAATPASAGMVAPLYESDPSDPTFRVGVESGRRYPEYVAGLNALTGGDLELAGGGMLVASLSDSEHESALRAAHAHRADGLEAEVLDAADAARLEPAIAPDVGSFLWLPDAARLDSRALATALMAAIEAAGVHRLFAHAVGLAVAGGRAGGVRLADGASVDGSGVVVAAGCWSGELGDPSRRLPVRPVRGQMLRLESGQLPLGPILADHSGRYLVPRVGGALAGSTMDESGFEAEVTDAGCASIRDAVRRLCPAAGDARAVESWAGLRPVSDDGAPIVGPDPDVEGVYYATGYGRSGILLAPLLAEIVADLALGREPDVAWKTLSVERFERTAASGSGNRA